MKKILFGLLFVYSFAFSLEINAEKSTVTTDVGKTELNQEKDTKEIGLKKVEGLDLITILVENGNYELANNLLMTLDEEEKKTKKYYENRAKINNGLGKKDDAIRDYNYILDNFQDIDKLYYDFEILKVYVTDEKYSDDTLKLIKKLKKMKLDKESKNKLKELEKIYKKKVNIEYVRNIELGLAYNDNLYNLKEDKVGDMYTNMNFTLMGVNKISDKYNLTFFGSYRNQLYQKESSKTNHNIFFGGQPQYFINDKFNVSAPSMLKLTFENGKYSEFGLNIGALAYKTINDMSNINIGIDIGYKNNKTDNYKGNTFMLYSIYNFIDKSERINAINLNFGQESYSENTYNNKYINIGVNRTQKWKEKYNLNYGYTLNYKLNELEIDGTKKKDMSHNFNGNLSGKTIFDINWKVGYTFIYGDSNINSYDYINNILSTVISREF